MPETLVRLAANALGWLKARERRVLVMTAAAQLLILLAMIGLRALPLLTGQTLLVRVQPVDPRDLFRGDYVILSYDFSRVSPQEIEGLPETWRGKRVGWEDRTIYVPLVQDEDRVHWKAAKVTAVKPVTGPFLKGQMGRYGSLRFGIESYFVQEGTGRHYEQAIRDRKLSAELAVTSSGQAALRALRID